MLQLKHAIILAVVFIMPLAAVCADKLTITRLTGSKVSIGGRQLKAGDSFDEGDAISWASATQQMEAKKDGPVQIRYLWIGVEQCQRLPVVDPPQVLQQGIELIGKLIGRYAGAERPAAFS